MLRIFAVLLLSAMLGAGLALAAGHWPVRPGIFGLTLMLLAALAARQRWRGLGDSAPGSPERALWISLGGHAIVAAHLCATLWHIGPNLVMHTAQVHAMGVDNWTLVAGLVLAHLLARDPQPRSDERDQWIAQRGLRAAHYGLLVILLCPILALGFVREGWIAQLSHPFIANALMVCIILSVVVDRVVCLHAYRAEADADAGAT